MKSELEIILSDWQERIETYKYESERLDALGNIHESHRCAAKANEIIKCLQEVKAIINKDQQ